MFVTRYGLPHNPYKKDTDMVRREAAEADLVLGECHNELSAL